MTTNEKLRFALRNIEGLAVAALANQPHDDDECGRHLNKALAGIELAARTSRGTAGEKRLTTRRHEPEQEAKS